MISKILTPILIFWSSCAFSSPLKVTTTLPDWADLAREIGGSEVQAESLLSGDEDPHFLDASPYFIKKVMGSDLILSSGLGLEIGWLPKVLARSGKKSLQPGGEGYFELGSVIDVLEKPTQKFDRSQGDVHGQGNPHFNISPCALLQAGKGLADRLSKIRPEKKEFFQANFKSWSERTQKLKDELQSEIQERWPKSTPHFMEYHKEFVYFWKCYDLRSIGSIEALPGVPPSAPLLLQAAQRAKKENVVLAIASLQSSEKHIEKFHQLSGIPTIKVPTMVQTSGDTNTIEQLQKLLIKSILSAGNQKP